ncbi:multidrug efflux pump [Pseudomonas nitritireducens]|uniref:Efflux pump membrane transporter n=1 Tax=Pseudomonas nitroreducens TaxID=46680 RepID=A0A7W7KTK2_PSENT|nr:multidrug efflux RND transporter permease subunit [Pseudomonas nitritireducens]MBB4868228.1 multidrug efflux pump [Pseudomonas nitritireducens]
MNFSQFFIRRPIFAVVLSLLLVIGGAVSLFQLPVSEYPEVVPPTIVVRAQFPGANPDVLSKTVASPLEQAITGVENMLYMSSQSTSDGLMSLTLTFALGTNLNDALVQVQSRVNRAQSQLPPDVQRLGVTVDKTSPALAQVVHLHSPNGQYDPIYLANYMKIHVIDELYKLKGVSDIRLLGMGDYALRVWLDPDKVASYNLAVTDVIQAIREQNREVAVGSLGTPPSASNSAFQLLINARGRLVDEDEFEHIVVNASEHGEIVRLSDIARIELGSSQYALRAHLDGRPSAALQIFQDADANTLELSDRIRQRMDTLAQDFPPGIAHAIGYDPTIFVRNSISAVVFTLFEAVALVVLVVILFLQTWRASIIPLAAVPVSLIGTFAVMQLLGFSINALSLFGLVLAIGIVVDDAIVVVENVERNIALGKSPVEATRQAMKEVSGPIIATALVLCAVFVPTAFISGLTGQFYRQFSLTIAISTVISAFNSLTLSPALAAMLLKEHDAPKDRLSVLIERVFGGWLFRPFNRLFQRASNGYAGITTRLLRSGFVVLLLYSALIGLAYLGLEKTPTGFIPQQDKQYLVAFAQLPEGSSLDRTEAVILKMSELALQQPGVANTVSFSGLSINGFVNSSSAGLMFIPLKSFDERKDASLSDVAIAQALTAQYEKIQEAFVMVVPPPPVESLGTIGGFRVQIEDRGNLGHEELYRQIQTVVDKARELPELSGVFSGYQVNVPQFEADIDRDKAKAHGVAINDIFDTLQVYLGSMYANDFNRFGRTYHVNVQAEQQYRSAPEQIGQLRVRSRQGDLIPLSSFVQVRESAGPDRVMHYNGFLSAEINGGPAPGYSSGQAQAAMERLLQEELPNGMTYEWTELTYQQILAGNTALFVFPLCVLLAFLVLAAQYESWSLPLVVILIVPMTLLSAIGGVLLSGGDNNIFTQISLIVLVGLACKNAILLVEFAREKQVQGLSFISAVLEACRLRLRPILMTSIAFIMGVVPLALSTGAGAEMRRAMGIAVFSGMIGVTIFGLLLTPVFYVLMQRLAERYRAGNLVGSVTATEGRP